MLLLQEVDRRYQFLPAAHFDQDGGRLGQGLAPLAELLPADRSGTYSHVQVFQTIIVIDVNVLCQGPHLFIPIFYGAAGDSCVGDVIANPEAGMVSKTHGQFCQQAG